MAGVLNAARRKGLYMQSHFMGLHGKDLSAYHLTGLGGNHELRNADDVTEVLEAGGWVDMCGSSSIADTLDNLLPAIKAFPNPSILNVTLCTDDVHAADLIDRKHGHINKVVARVIKAGLKPETAIAFATRNIAREYGIDNLGVIKPGNLADVIIFDSFETLEPTAVFVGGRLEAENGKPVKPLDAELSRPSANLQEKVGATMRLSPVKPEALIPAAENNRDTVTVNTISFNGLFSKKGQVTLPAVNGRPDITGRDDLCYVAVLDRYGKDTVALGVLENYGLTCGAAATTVSHDSHNLTLIYKDASLAAFIANQVIEAGGGIAAGTGTGPGECHIIKLPIGGLMSYSSAEELSPQIHALEEYLPRLFNGRQVSMLQMAILTLPVVPEARITNMGIVNTVTQEFIPLFQ
jgi:adenine deaminase